MYKKHFKYNAKRQNHLEFFLAGFLIQLHDYYQIVNIIKLPLTRVSFYIFVLYYLYIYIDKNNCVRYEKKRHQDFISR